MGPAAGPLGRFVRDYLERVVNQRDVSAVDDLVALDYVGSGHGWPQDREALRRFYVEQARDRPDWRIDVQSSLELGDSVVVRAHAGGTVQVDGVAARKDLEWLTRYRVSEGRIREIHVLALVPRADGATG